MLVQLSPAQISECEPTPADHAVAEPERKPRRGVTTMEYLVMLSFILLAVILTVQGIGSMTGNLLGKSAEATEKTNTP